MLVYDECWNGSPSCGVEVRLCLAAVELPKFPRGESYNTVHYSLPANQVHIHLKTLRGAKLARLTCSADPGSRDRLKLLQEAERSQCDLQKALINKTCSFIIMR